MPVLSDGNKWKCPVVPDDTEVMKPRIVRKADELTGEAVKMGEIRNVQNGRSGGSTEVKHATQRENILQ